MSTYRYGTTNAKAVPAEGTSGILIRSFGTYLFRVYHADGEFTDYELRHDDLAVTIAPDALASFYTVGERNLLDHSPDVLGLQHVAP